MLLFPNALCCSPYERNYICAVTKIFMKFLPVNNFCQLLRVTRKRSCTSAGNAQAQLHFQDDQQRAFGISNISNWIETQKPSKSFFLDRHIWSMMSILRSSLITSTALVERLVCLWEIRLIRFYWLSRPYNFLLFVVRLSFQSGMVFGGYLIVVICWIVSLNNCYFDYGCCDTK